MSGEAPRVSIVTPVLNAEDFLEETIASVTAQTVGDFELILVDDGSTDKSRAIAEAAAARDPRIRPMARRADELPGAARSRNRGIAAARGEHIAFLDADDRLEPRMLEVTLAAMDRHPEVGMVFGPTHWWHPDEPRRDWVEVMYGRADKVFAPPRLLSEIVLVQTGHVPCIGSILVRGSALQKVGGFEERFALYEDQALWVKLFATESVYVTGEVLSHYRQHGRSASAAAEAQQQYSRTAPHEARRAFLDWTRDWLATSGKSTPALERALRIAGRPYDGCTGLAAAVDRAVLSWSRWRMRVPQRLANRWRRMGGGRSGEP